MVGRVVIVTAGDENYFGVLDELIRSIQSHPESSGVDIAVMDVGLNGDQAENIRTRGATVVSPEWPSKKVEKRSRGREYLKACVCRPFINKIVPGYDVYVWLDTDTWVQDWEAINLLVRGANKGALACTLLLDRGYPASKRIKWFGRLPLKARGFYYSNAKRAFPRSVARELFNHHTISAGAFALRGDAKHWERWQELLLAAVKKGKLFTAEQLTLGIVIHVEGHQAEFLPAWTHWVCMDHILWDENKRVFVEPYLPNHRLGIIHLSGLDDMRRDPSVLTEVVTTDGEHVNMSLRYMGQRTMSDRVIEADQGVDDER